MLGIVGGGLTNLGTLLSRGFRILTKNIATFKMDIVMIRATLKISFVKNCGTLKNTEIYKRKGPSISLP